MVTFDPEATYRHLTAVEETRRQRQLTGSLVRMWDGSMDVNLEVRNEVSLEGEDVDFTPGGGKLVLPLASPEGWWATRGIGAAEDLHVTVETRGFSDRITYSAVSVHEDEDEAGVELVEIELRTILHHWESTILKANPLLPDAIQWPHIFALPGHTRSIYKTSLRANLPTGADAPFVVAPTIGTDRSRPTITSWRYDVALEAMTQGMRDAHCIPTARMWLPGDEQPFPSYRVLRKPTIIFDVEQHDGAPGVTGTTAGGFIGIIVQLASDLITEVVRPVITGTSPTSPEQLYELSGAVQGLPLYRRGEYSGLIASRKTIHKSQGYIVYTGGRSPEWVNQGIRLAITTALAWIGFAMAIPGLDNLYTGQFDNVVLAFARVEDRNRGRQAGRFAKRDVWSGDAETGFGISTAIGLRSGWWNSRPFISREVQVIDGHPHLIGDTVRKGTWCCFEQPDGSIYLDQVTAVSFARSREQELIWSLRVGDDRGDEDPVAALWRHYKHVRGTLRRLFLEH